MRFCRFWTIPDPAISSIRAGIDAGTKDLQDKRERCERREQAEVSSRGTDLVDL